MLWCTCFRKFISTPADFFQVRSNSCGYHNSPESHAASYWDDETNRREFFKSFASKEGFDPLIAKNWYQVQYSAFLKYQVMSDTSLGAY